MCLPRMVTVEPERPHGRIWKPSDGRYHSPRGAAAGRRNRRPGRRRDAVAAAPENAAKAVATFTGGRVTEEARITLDLAAAVEDGNSVPLSVTVESPMRADDYVSEILVVAEANPWPRVASFQFTPMAGRAAFSTRIRLSASQNVIVLAKISDGRIYTAKQHVEVTIGACTQ